MEKIIFKIRIILIFSKLVRINNDKKIQVNKKDALNVIKKLDILDFLM